MGRPTRWVTDTGPDHSEWYIERFRNMAAEGADLAGEARLVDALVGRESRLLDAGCGPGRVAGELALRGHDVVGVDADPALIEAAETDHPGPRYLAADLADLELASMGEPEPFDAAVIVGNVFWFVAADTEADVVARVAAHVRPDGLVVVGYGTAKGYSLEMFDRHCAAAGLVREHRFATWDLRPWTPEADFAVTICRKP